MPIANCHITAPAAEGDADEIASRWAARAGIDPAEMTINLISAQQGGKRYGAMAWLYLPSLWDDHAVESLSEGLAAALAEVLRIDDRSVLVLTTIVQPGLVVEDGRVVSW